MSVNLKESARLKNKDDYAYGNRANGEEAEEKDKHKPSLEAPQLNANVK